MNNTNDRIYFPIPIIVEGKYDKSKLASVFSGCIITTDGFGIFKKKEKLALIRALGKDGIVVLTDSDGAGKVIRSYLSSALPKDKIYHLYTPRIEGKERRKSAPSAEGVLGVEGMELDLLRDLLARFARANGFSENDGEHGKSGDGVTKTDLYEAGLTGGENSSVMRDELAEKLGMPPGMTANALLSAVNILMTRDEFRQMMSLE